MNTFFSSNSININKTSYIFHEKEIYPEHIKKVIDSNTSILYLGDNFSFDNSIVDMFNEHIFDKLIIIGNIDKKYKRKRLFINNYITKSILEHVKNQLFIIVEIPTDSNKLQKIIKQLIKINKLCSTLKIKCTKNVSDSTVLGYLVSENSTYINDIANTLYILSLNNKKSQYEFIYDTVCKYLDYQFSHNNYCNFKGNQCIANKHNSVSHCSMGCCYSFEYANFFEPTFTKNIKVCKLFQDKSCSTSCISCKLFTCKELHKRNISFKTTDFPLLNCFFNKKQHLILTYNFFRTKEEIIEKLLEKNTTPFLLYYSKSNYRI